MVRRFDVLVDEPNDPFFVDIVRPAPGDAALRIQHPIVARSALGGIRENWEIEVERFGGSQRRPNATDDIVVGNREAVQPRAVGGGDQFLGRESAVGEGRVRVQFRLAFAADRGPPEGCEQSIKERL